VYRICPVVLLLKPLAWGGLFDCCVIETQLNGLSVLARRVD